MVSALEIRVGKVSRTYSAAWDAVSAAGHMFLDVLVCFPDQLSQDLETQAAALNLGSPTRNQVGRPESVAILALSAEDSSVVVHEQLTSALRRDAGGERGSFNGSWH